MKWQNSAHPKDGDTRVVTRFLFLPCRIENESRWLEIASVKQEYVWGWYEGWWVNTEWVGDGPD